MRSLGYRSHERIDKEFMRIKLALVCGLTGFLTSYGSVLAAQTEASRPEEKIAALRLQIASLKEIEAKLVDTGDMQISLTDPDSRSMMTPGSGIVG